MSWTLRFSSRLTYDASQPSIALPVHVALGSRFVTASAKLDTGASHSIFCREIGEELGLDVATGERLGIETVTGRFVCFGHGVTLTAAGVMVDTVVYFAAESGLPVNVLGRSGFIDRLRLGIVDYDGVLLASSYDDPAE